MRSILLLLFLAPFLYNCSTTEHVAITLPDMQVAYKGYDVLIKLEGADSTEVYQIDCTECDTTHSASVPNTYIIRVSDSTPRKWITVNALDEHDKIVGSTEVYALNIPNPSIYLGSTLNGGKLKGEYRHMIFVKYDPGIPLNAAFAVKSWELHYGNKTISGVGSSLSQKARKMIEEIESDGVFSLIVKVRGPNRKERVLGASFQK